MEPNDNKFEILCRQMEVQLERKLTAEERAAVRLSIPALGPTPVIERRKIAGRNSPPEASD